MMENIIVGSFLPIDNAYLMYFCFNEESNITLDYYHFVFQHLADVVYVDPISHWITRMYMNLVHIERAKPTY